MSIPAPIQFDRDGLIPVVTQDAVSGEVLMLAFMNQQALQLTQDTGLVHYWSRSRNALWLKGETSGNRQQLISINVNCELNSILLKVLQTGAVCHDGFDTCFYRSILRDGTLQVERDRVFDPAHVYGRARDDVRTFQNSVREQFEAYEYLRDQDLTDVSSTSRLLRNPDSRSLTRVSDELRELAAVLTGLHVHRDRAHDIMLEGSQVIYWVYISALGVGSTWNQIRPDVALATPIQDVADGVLQELIEAFATRWQDSVDHGDSDGALAHATISLVAQVCRVEHIDQLAVVEFDLRDLQRRAYLEDFFCGRSPYSPPA